MAIQGLKGVIGACIAGSMMFSSTAAMAAAAPTPQVDPWAALTAMSSGAPAAAVCGSAAASAAAPGAPGCVLPVADAPPPPPPPPAVAEAGGGISPILIGLLALAAGIGIFLAIHDNGTANSPA